MTPGDGSEITSFNITKKPTMNAVKEEPASGTPRDQSPSNEFRSADCNEILANELADLDDKSEGYQLVSQSSVEIDFASAYDRRQPSVDLDAEVSDTCVQLVHL